MSLFKKLVFVIIYYVILIITFFLPKIMSEIILVSSSFCFVIYLFVLNAKANHELKNQKEDSFWFLVINMIAFSIIQLVLLYGLMGWVII